MMIRILELWVTMLTWLMRLAFLLFLVLFLIFMEVFVPSVRPLTLYFHRYLPLTLTYGMAIPGIVVCILMHSLFYLVRKHLNQKIVQFRSRRFIKHMKVEQIRISDLRLIPHAPLSHIRSVATIVHDLGNRQEIESVALLNEIIAGGFSVGASDIHLIPERDKAYATYRVDGVLHEVGSISHEAARYLRNRMKVLARLSIETRTKPQDGAITFDVEDYHIRVSFLPTNHGEKAVLRLAIHGGSRYCLDSLGLDSDLLQQYKGFLESDHGLIYLTGPTGSGKTTTLYASLMHIRANRGDTVNMVTLEDPIEVDFKGISQTQVDPGARLTFALGLRSILRQDPDVIMVGEIRDEETAQVAIRAGMTGHLIMTSVHADSTAGVFNRLKQLNVERFQMASASLAAVNQRLAISNCPDCRAEVSITPFQRNQLKSLGLDESGPFYAGQGCETCGGKGRLGRVPLFELLPVTDRIRDLLVAETPTHKILEAARQEGMVPLALQALDKARQGILSVQEVVRVLSAGSGEGSIAPTRSKTRRKKKSGLMRPSVVIRRPADQKSEVSRTTSSVVSRTARDRELRPS